MDGCFAALRKLDIHGRSIESSYNDRLVRLPEPRFIEPQLRLTGMFSCLADAAVITLCADGRWLPPRDRLFRDRW
jgi:uncharacterized lipoprotein NlpE involved in copper resistance